MKLLTQPGDSVAPLVKAINSAKSSVEIVIFRFDRKELERALMSAAERGVFVHALIAYTNRGGEKNLRALEMRLLGAGVTVARTADDLIRYHAKLMIIDRSELHLLGFNFTYLDMEHSRSFGVIVKNRRVVREAIRLFEADTTRQAYSAGLSSFIVSPLNARKQLAKFIDAAKKRLLIYDPKISDPAMLRLLEERSKAGVEIRIIGCVERNRSSFPIRKMVRQRLHTRTILRDSDHIFLGSQSLRAAELDQRREVGLIFRDTKIAARLRQMFDEDWETAEPVEMKPEAAKPIAERFGGNNIGQAMYRDIRDKNSVFEGFAAVTGGGVTLSDGDSAERVDGLAVSPNFFQTLGVTAILDASPFQRTAIRSASSAIVCGMAALMAAALCLDARS
jgi:cardiolipin synthase